MGRSKSVVGIGGERRREEIVKREEGRPCRRFGGE